MCEEAFMNCTFPKRIGVIDNIKKFDRVFFGVHQELTKALDPVSRMLLEDTFAAIMDAGINPRTLKGKNIGVFTASSISETEKILFNRRTQVK